MSSIDSAAWAGPVPPVLNPAGRLRCQKDRLCSSRLGPVDALPQAPTATDPLPSQEHLQFWEWAPEHLAAVNASNKFDNREGGWSYEVFNSFGLPDFLG